MKTRRLLSAILAMLMVVSMIALPVSAETIATADGKLVGTVYAATSTLTWNDPYNDVTRATDDDLTTQWKCVGQNSYTAKTQYFGYYYAGGAVIDSVSFKAGGYAQYIEETHPYGGIRIEVSTDATNWYTIWEDLEAAYKDQVVTLNADNWDTTVMTEDTVWNYVRLAYGDETQYCGWDMLQVYDFQVFGEYVVPADAIVSSTKIASPLSTGFGTRANILENAYVVSQDGLNGLGFILKVEGLGDTSATMYGIDPVISQTVETTTEQTKVDEAGNEVLDADGNPVTETVTTSEKVTYSLGWHGNWVNTSCNKITFEGDGYYMYYVPFNALANNLSMTSVAGDTTVSAFNVFRSDMAFHNPGVSEVMDGVTVSLVGICEDTVPAGSLFVKDADGTTLLGTGATAAAMDGTWISNSGCWVRSVTSIADIYEGNGAAPHGQAIDHYVDANGTEYAIDDYVLGTVNLTAVYGERDVVKYTASVSELKAGEEATVTVKVDDAALVSAGKVTVAYDANAFTCEDNVIEYTEIAEDGTIGTVTVKLNKLASSGDYTFALTAEATSAKGDVIAEYEDATVTYTSSQPAGIYFENSDVVSLGDGSAEVNIWEGDYKFPAAVAGLTFVYKLDGIETPIDPGCLDTNFYYSDAASKNLSHSNWFYNADDWCGGCLRDHMPNYEKDGVYYTYLNMRITDGSDDWFYGVKDFAIFHVYNDGTTIVNENTNATAQMLAIVENNLAPTATFYDAEGNVIATQTNQYTKGATAQNWSGNPAECYGTGLVKTPDELFAASGAATPTKADNEDGTPNLFSYWVDADGNKVDAVYYNVDLYPAFTSDYVEYDATVSVIDDEATLIITADGTAADKLDAGTINVAIDENVFTSDKAVDGVISVDFDLTPATTETPEEGTTEEGTTEEVATASEEPAILATIVLNIKPLVATKDYSVAISGTAADAEGNAIFVKNSTATVPVVGQDVTGAFLTEEKVVINSAAEGSAPATQTVWTGNVDLGGADIATFVFKIEGVETAMDFTQFAPIVNGSHVVGQNGNTWLWDNHWGADAADEDGMRANGFAAGMKIAENGTYYVSMARRYIANDGSTKYNTVNGFKLFQTPNTMSNDAATVNYSATNTNEAATFQMLAILAGDLTPTVNFYTDNADELGSYEYKYSTLTGYADGNGANTKMKSFGALASAADIFAASGIATPTKEADDQYVYVFAGWVDAEGNDVDAIYYDMDVYAAFTPVEKTSKVTVTYVDNGVEYYSEEVFESDVPAGPETDPTKADSATGTYTFAGWSLTEDGEVIDLASYSVTEPTILYAVYNYADVVFNVTYVDYNGKTIYTEPVVRSNDAAYATIPTRATDAYNEELQGGYKYTFNYWGVTVTDEETGAVSYEKADLTNIQADITVTAVYEATLVEEWFTVTWVDSDGSVLSTKKVATGEGASTTAKGALNGIADENVWYTFSGWDKETTVVTEDMTVTIVYTETPVATSADGDIVIATGSGTVGEQNELINSSTPYTFTAPNGYVTFIFDIKGASAENPISIGGIRFQSVNGGTQIDSNNSGNYGTGSLALKEVTEDGLYYVTVGHYVMTWVGSDWEVIKELTIDHSGSTRGGVSAGEGTYDVTVIEGKFEPTVRFYDEDGNWLYTGKNVVSANQWTFSGKRVPAPADLYNGAEIENFEAWVDAEGNVVSQVSGNMDVYAKTAHVCEFVATGAGTAECDCGETKTDAFTIIAGEATVADVKAGDTITVPVIVNNGSFVGVTFDVTTSDNVTVTAIDVTGTAFDGYTAEYADGRVVLNAATGGEDITADGTIVNLTLTAAADIAADEIVTVKVDAVQVVDLAGDITASVATGYTASYTATVTASEVLWGDVNNDKAIDGTDAMLLNRYTSGWGEDDYAAASNLLTAGDINNDGAVDGTDAMLLNRYTSGWGEDDYSAAVNLLKALATLG